jgi:uncharacterized Zn-binding protein involved in type VI secretion
MDTFDDKRLIGRRPLLGGLAAAAALTPGGASADPAPGAAQMASMLQASSRAQLAALEGGIGQAALLTEQGRQGFFVLREGALPAQDPLQGLTVPSQRRGQHWARMWDGTHGLPEWFGARSGDPAAARDNRIALEACVALCPVTQLAAGAYYIADTFRIAVSNRTVRGATLSIEAPFDGGTRIVCTDAGKDVIRVGGTGASNRPAIIRLEEITAAWSVNLVPPPRGREGEAPSAFHVEHVLAAHLERCFALDPLIGFRFNGIINSRCINYGVTRLKRYGGASDFVRGVWVQGRPRLFAGGNASLYLMDGNVTTSGDARAAYYQPMGVFADADFADLYIMGLETSNIAFPIVLDGAGGNYSGGHGDVFIRNVVIDQIIGDGITIRNTNPLAKIQIDGGYIQVVDSRGRNKGLWLENGQGQITVANLQITGEDSSATSIGIYLKDRPNVAISDTVIVENIAFPVTVDRGCPRLSLGCTINAGNLRARGHAAVTVDGASQSLLRPKVTGAPGAWTAGVELLGAGHDRVSIDPTMIDPASVSAGRKVVINGKPVRATGHRAATGDPAPEGAGINVTGVVG